MKVFLLGASGLVGSSVFSRLILQKPALELHSFARRRLHLHGASEHVGELKDFASLMEGLSGDAALCAVGTTLKKAKTREAFEEVDLNLPLRFACAAADHGVKSFHVITTLGADPSSKNHYMRVKGVLEKELGALGFQGLHIYRPSLLMGVRDEFRLGEELLSGLYKRFQFAYPKALDKYRPIEVDQLSSFIVRKLIENSPGTHIWENQDMLSG